MTKIQLNNRREPRNGGADWLNGVIPLAEPLVWVGVICALLIIQSFTTPVAGSIAWLIGLIVLGVIWTASVERPWWQVLLIQVHLECIGRIVSNIPIFNYCISSAKLSPQFKKQLKYEVFARKQLKRSFLRPLMCRPAVQTSAPNQCEFGNAASLFKRPTHLKIWWLL